MRHLHSLSISQMVCSGPNQSLFLPFPASLTQTITFELHRCKCPQQCLFRPQTSSSSSLASFARSFAASSSFLPDFYFCFCLARHPSSVVVLFEQRTDKPDSGNATFLVRHDPRALLLASASFRSLTSGSSFSSKYLRVGSPNRPTIVCALRSYPPNVLLAQVIFIFGRSSLRVRTHFLRQANYRFHVSRTRSHPFD